MSKRSISLVAIAGFLVLAMLPALADSAVQPTFVAGSTNCSNVSSAPGGLSLTITEPVMGSSSHVGPDGSVFQLTGTTRKTFNFSTTALVYDVVVKGSASNWYDYDGTGDGPVRTDTDLVIPNGNKLNLIHFCYSGNAAPVATADAYSTNEDTQLSVAAPGVLANDTDANGDALTAVEVSDPGNRVTLNANGSFIFTPVANFSGSYVFSYRANDGFTNSNTVNVTITVNALNDAPVAVADSYNTNEDTMLTVTVPGVLGNDTDIDSATLTAVLVSGVSDGTLNLSSDGSFTYDPNDGFNGGDSFTYKANDGSADSNTVTVSITVGAVNDAPVAGDDSASVVAGGSVLIDVLANDTDADNDALTIVAGSVSDPANGTAVINAGKIQYTPDSGFFGAADTFTYSVNDGNGGSDTATVTVTVFEGELSCNETVTSSDETSGMSALFKRLLVGPCATSKLYTINLEPSFGDNGEIEFLIDPAFTEAAEYVGKLTFERFVPGNPNSQTFVWDLDVPGGTLTAADWCDSATFDVNGNLTSAVPPTGEDGCIASQTTQTVGSSGQAQTTWWVYFKFDLKTRG